MFSHYYYTCSVTVPTKFENKHNCPKARRFSFWVMVVFIVMTTPIAYFVHSTDFWIQILVMMMILTPTISSGVLMFLSLKNIRSFLIFNGMRNRLNIGWMFIQVLSFAIAILFCILGETFVIVSISHSRPFITLSGVAF